MVKKLGLKLAGVILWSLLLPGMEATAAQTEAPSGPGQPDLGQLLPATPNPPPGPQYRPPSNQNRQPRPPAPAGAERRPEATRVPPGRGQAPTASQPGPAQTPEIIQFTPGRGQAPADNNTAPTEQAAAAKPAQDQEQRERGPSSPQTAPPQPAGDRGAGSPLRWGSPLRLTEAMAAAGDLSPLQGCWEVQIRTSAWQCNHDITLCFDERGQGQRIIEDGYDIYAMIWAPAQAAYESGQLVINVGPGLHPIYDRSTPSVRIKCAPRGEKAAGCDYMFLEGDDYCAGKYPRGHPASLRLLKWQTAPPQQAERGRGAGSPLRLNEAMAVAGDLSPLQGRWEVEFGDVSPVCYGYSAAMYFDENGRGEMIIDHEDGPIKASLKAAYAEGRLVIESGLGSNAANNIFVSSSYITCVPMGEKAASCTSRHNGIGSGSGSGRCANSNSWLKSYPVSLRQR